MDVPSNDCRYQVYNAKVAIRTTGVIDSSAEGFNQHIMERVKVSSVCVHEEAHVQIMTGKSAGHSRRRLPSLFTHKNR